MSAEFTADELIAMYAELGRSIGGRTSGADALVAVTSVAVAAVPGVEFASITRDRTDHFQTLAPTDPVATAVDRLQYELASGPCVASVAGGGPFLTGDLAQDARWPVFGPRAGAEFGIRSMLSTRMVIDENVRASLNLYSRTPDAFGETSRTMAMLLSTHGAMAVGRVFEREQVVNLTRALENSRRIGIAVGVLMSSRNLTADQAFALIRIVSQDTNRRVTEVVEDVIETGQLDLPFGRPD